MRLKLKLGHKALLLVMVPLLFQFVLLSVFFYFLQQTEREMEAEAKGREVVEHVTTLFEALTHTVGEMTGYTVTGDARVLATLDRSQKKANEQYEWLDAHLQDDPQFSDSLHGLKQLLEQGFDELRYVQTATEQGDRVYALHKLIRLKPYLSVMERKVDDLVEKEKQLYRKHSLAGAEARKAIEQGIYAAVIGDLILAIVLVLLTNSGTIKRLMLLMDNTKRLAASKPLNPRISGDDEIAELDHVFHDMAEQLDAAAKRKMQILDMVAHDLRSPLSSAQLSLTMLNEGTYGTLPGKAQEVTRSLDGNVQRLIKLINDFLDVEKLQSGKLDLTKTNIDLMTVFQHSSDALEHLATRKNVSIECSDEAGTAYADYERMMQVMINLLGNAIKYSPDGGKVLVKAERDNEWITVSVTNAGPAIPVDAREKIFARFEQLSPEDKQHGTGLGLAICKAIVESHGGTIGVGDSANGIHPGSGEGDAASGRGSEAGAAVGAGGGSGACFWFKLPIVLDGAPAGDAQTPA